LHASALLNLPGGKERLAPELAALEFLWETGQLAEADELLKSLLIDVEVSQKAPLYRLAAKLATRRDMPARELEGRQQALDAKDGRRPEGIAVQAVRSDYRRLLNHYQGQAEALVSLRIAPPAGFREKVVRAADRWRALDRDGAEACRLAARILQT